MPAEIEARITPRTQGARAGHAQQSHGRRHAARTRSARSPRSPSATTSSSISDEIYAKLIFDGAEHLSIATLPGMRERTITINGFSKSYAMTGWRVGYLAAPQAFIQRMVEPRHTLSINAATPSQWAALAAATGPQSVVADMLAIYASRREVLLRGLDETRLHLRRAGRGLLRLHQRRGERHRLRAEFCGELLREARVLASPGMLFADPDDRYVRMSLLQPKERIEEALSRIKEARGRLFRA